MPRFILLFGLLACMLSASSCSLLKIFSRKDPPAAASKNRDIFIGIVESVNPEQKFVLVRTEMRLTLPPGTKLESRSVTGAKASLVLTPERKMSFLSADIAEGSPAVGDAVIVPAEATLAPATSPVSAIDRALATPDSAAVPAR